MSHTNAQAFGGWPQVDQPTYQEEYPWPPVQERKDRYLNQWSRRPALLPTPMPPQIEQDNYGIPDMWCWGLEPPCSSNDFYTPRVFHSSAELPNGYNQFIHNIPIQSNGSYTSGYYPEINSFTHHYNWEIPTRNRYSALQEGGVPPTRVWNQNDFNRNRNPNHTYRGPHQDSKNYQKPWN